MVPDELAWDNEDLSVKGTGCKSGACEKWALPQFPCISWRAFKREIEHAGHIGQDAATQEIEARPAVHLALH